MARPECLARLHFWAEMPDLNYLAAPGGIQYAREHGLIAVEAVRESETAATPEVMFNANAAAIAETRRAVGSALLAVGIRSTRRGHHEL